MRKVLDPAKLPSRKSGWTIAELAEFYKTTYTVISSWLSKMNNGKPTSPLSEGWIAKRVRVEDRFILAKGKPEKKKK